MQFRFRGNTWHEPSGQQHIGQWCEWTDLHNGYRLTLAGGVDLQFRERPADGVTPDFCPCGYMDKGTCGPQLCPRRARDAERERSPA